MCVRWGVKVCPAWRITTPMSPRRPFSGFQRSVGSRGLADKIKKTSNFYKEPLPLYMNHQSINKSINQSINAIYVYFYRVTRWICITSNPDHPSRAVRISSSLWVVTTRQGDWRNPWRLSKESPRTSGWCPDRPGNTPLMTQVSLPVIL